MNLAEFEGEPTVFDRVADLGFRVGQGRAGPARGCLQGPLAVIIAESSAERLLDQPNHRPGNEKPDHHPEHQPGRRPDQAATEFLQMFSERHRR